MGAALYEARRRLCRRLNLRRIFAGGRLSNYAEHADALTPESYVEKVKTGELKDPVFSFQLREGFTVRGILRHYITDPMSLNNASLIEWLNPDYIENEVSSKVRIACVQYQVMAYRPSPIPMWRPYSSRISISKISTVPEPPVR